MQMTIGRLVFAALPALRVGTGVATPARPVAAATQVSLITLPDGSQHTLVTPAGLHVTLYASGLSSARFMALGPLGAARRGVRHRHATAAPLPRRPSSGLSRLDLPVAVDGIQGGVYPGRRNPCRSAARSDKRLVEWQHGMGASHRRARHRGRQSAHLRRPGRRRLSPGASGPVIAPYAHWGADPATRAVAQPDVVPAVIRRQDIQPIAGVDATQNATVPVGAIAHEQDVGRHDNRAIIAIRGARVVVP